MYFEIRIDELIHLKRIFILFFLNFIFKIVF